MIDVMLTSALLYSVPRTATYLSQPLDDRGENASIEWKLRRAFAGFTALCIKTIGVARWNGLTRVNLDNLWISYLFLSYMRAKTGEQPPVNFALTFGFFQATGGAINLFRDLSQGVLSERCPPLSKWIASRRNIGIPILDADISLEDKIKLYNSVCRELIKKGHLNPRLTIKKQNNPS